VCLDETSKQLIIETRAPIPQKPGQPARRDYERQRNGVANLFMIFAPLEGWRRVEVTDRHAAVDCAKVLKDLSDVHFPAAEKIVLVQGQSEHPYAGLALRRLPPRSPSPRQPVRVALRAKTWKLARHGRIRTRRSRHSVPEPPHPRQAAP
jgi:hypothetical protein